MMSKSPWFFLAFFLSWSAIALSSPSDLELETHQITLSDGVVIIHTLSINPSRYRVEIGRAAGSLLALEKTSSIAKRHHAIAAVNGGFFTGRGAFAGAPVGLLVADREFLSMNHRNRAALGWNKHDSSFHIDRIQNSVTLLIDDHPYPVDGWNAPRKDHQAVLYSSAWGKTTLTEKNGFEWGLRPNHQVFQSAFHGNSPILSKGYVLSVGPQSPLSIAAAPNISRWELQIAFTPQLIPRNASMWGKFDNVVAGAGLLIFNGEKIDDFSIEKLSSSFVNDRHARTLFGVKSDGTLVLAVVEEDASLHSVGMTLPEVRDWLYAWGCEEAFCLDGGSSSTLFYQGALVYPQLIHNEDILQDFIPERAVNNALLIIPREEKTDE